MALLPPIPDRPADRPETWAEYLSRRAIVAMHRQFVDELAGFVKHAHTSIFSDPFEYFRRLADRDARYLRRRAARDAPTFDSFIDMAGNRVPFTTGRSDAVRRLLADRDAHNLFFTDFGVLQVQDLTIDLAPELKELSGPRKRRAGTNPTS